MGEILKWRKEYAVQQVGKRIITLCGTNIRQGQVGKRVRISIEIRVIVQGKGTLCSDKYHNKCSLNN